MGAWGAGTFENDDASDWVYELEKSNDPSVVEAALSVSLRSAEGHIDAQVGRNALAAAEVVAALCGRPSDRLPDEVQQWLIGKPAPDGEVISKAPLALNVVMGANSELAELWRDADPKHFEEWKAGVEDLQRRLG